MKLHTKQKFVLGIGLAALTQVPLFAAETITLGEEGAQQFQNAISAKAYDRALGSFYVGSGDNGDGEFALARLDRVNNFFTPLAPENNVTNNKAVNALALTGDCRGGATHLASVIEGATDDERKVTLSKLEDNGETATQTGILQDAVSNNALRVTHLAGNDKYVFARVQSANDDPEGTGTDSAITLLELTGDTLTVRDTERFDRTITVVRSGTDEDLASLQVRAMHWNEELQTLYIASRIQIADTNVNNVGYAIVKANVENNNLVLSRITPATPIANEVFGGVFAWAAGLGFEDAITGATLDITHITTHKSSTGHHFITVAGGPVVRTGAVENSPEDLQAGNVIHTFPLDPTTGCIVQNVLTNATYQTPLADGFGQLSTSPTDAACRSVAYNPDHSNEFVAAQHGLNEVYPWPGFQPPSDLVAIDDAIYVAYDGGTPQNANLGGVWRIEQVYGFDGASAGFSMEVKRAYPSVGNHETDRTKFVEVDGKTGNVLRIGTDNPNSVQRTVWQRRGFDENSLPAVINDAFPEGVFAVADFHGSLSEGESQLGSPPCDLVLGLNGNRGLTPQHSLSLFGGCEKVLITHNTGPVDSANQYQVTQNYNFQEDDEAPFRHKKCTTSGLEGTGRVRALGYAEVRHTRLWLVAGTECGLYVYGKENGDALTNDNTDEDPYGFLDDTNIWNDDTDKWHRVGQSVEDGCPLSGTEQIQGSVISLGFQAGNFLAENSRRAFYPLTQCSSTNGAITDRVYQVGMRNPEGGDDQENVENFTIKVVAQSGRGGLPVNTRITGVSSLSNRSIQSGNNPAGTSFLVLATSNGVWVSGIPSKDLTDADSSDFRQVETTAGRAFIFAGNQGRQNGSDDKVIGIALSDCDVNLPAFTVDSSLEHSRYYQFHIGANNNVSTLPSGLVFWTSNADKAAAVCPQLSCYLWSDGGRRLFVSNADFERLDDGLFDDNNHYGKSLNHVTNRINSLPFNTQQWNQQKPFIGDTTKALGRVHWVQDIWATGQLLVGTSNGVVSLQ